jgi:hypothetical protein
MARNILFNCTGKFVRSFSWKRSSEDVRERKVKPNAVGVDFSFTADRLGGQQRQDVHCTMAVHGGQGRNEVRDER